MVRRPRFLFFFWGLLVVWALRLLALSLFFFYIGYTPGFGGPAKGPLSWETGHGVSTNWTMHQEVWNHSLKLSQEGIQILWFDFSRLHMSMCSGKLMQRKVIQCTEPYAHNIL